MKAWLASAGFESAFLDKDKTTGIPPGADWERTLYREVKQSQAVIDNQPGTKNKIRVQLKKPHEG